MNWMRCVTCGNACEDNGFHDECRSCRRKKMEDIDDRKADIAYEDIKDREMEEKNK